MEMTPEEALKFQSSFELTGYITLLNLLRQGVMLLFQSSFELTGYITSNKIYVLDYDQHVSKLFRAYGLYNLCSLEGA